MLCNVCGKADATIHLTEIINGQMLELHLCEVCGNEKEGGLKLQFSFNDLLLGLTDYSNLKAGEKKEAAKCASCGLTYEEFSKAGRLGCPACYQSFGRVLYSLIKRVQKGTQHTGKRPGKAPDGAVNPADLRLLREQLRKAIEREEFEEAARVRDRIKQLETQMKKNPKKNDKNQAGKE